MIPHGVHYGTAETLRLQGAQVLQQAYEVNTLRFRGCVPQPPALPTPAWINPPKETALPKNAEPCTVISINRMFQSD